MTSFFDKLSTLIRARVSTFLDDITPDFGSSTSTEPKPRTVKALRERVNQAIEYEKDLQRQIEAQERDIATLNEQADRAVQQGNEAMARHLIAKVQRTQQHTGMLRADLAMHQKVAQDLILQVNELDAVIADMENESKAASDAQSQAEANAERSHEIVNRFHRVFDSAQNTIDSLGERLRLRKDQTENQIEETPPQADSPSVNDELEARRNRLMKK